VTAARPVVAALAGRRIDAPGAPRRFPRDHEAAVRQRLEALFERQSIRAVVSSAACGADLIALDIAGRLGLRRIVILPHDQRAFRARSVVDRGEEWGPRFDRVMRETAEAGGLQILNLSGEEEARYRATNDAVVAHAIEVAAASPGDWQARAVVAWDGRARDDRDITAHFKRAALARGLPVDEVSTL
jgi:hypothetical protein